jgi:hypothetical protein
MTPPTLEERKAVRDLGTFLDHKTFEATPVFQPPVEEPPFAHPEE